MFISTSSILSTSRSFLLIRLDQSPDKLCLSCSGLPVPVVGCCVFLPIILRLFYKKKYHFFSNRLNLVLPDLKNLIHNSSKKAFNSFLVLTVVLFPSFICFSDSLI